MMHLTAPLPPTTNNAYANVGRRRVKTAAARAYARRVGLIAWAEAKAARLAPGPADWLAVEARVWFPDRRRRDVANCEKLLVDAICAVLGVDDSRVAVNDFRLGGYDPVRPRVEVTVRVLGAEEVTWEAGNRPVNCKGRS